MNLSQRGGGDWLLLEGREALQEWCSECGFKRGLYLLERKGWHVLLQTLQFLNVLTGEEVGARAENLADLDEGRTQVHERSDEVLRDVQPSLALFFTQMLELAETCHFAEQDVADGHTAADVARRALRNRSRLLGLVLR